MTKKQQKTTLDNEIKDIPTTREISSCTEYMPALLTQIRRMEDLAFISAYGKNQVPGVAERCGILPGDGYDVIHKKYAYASCLASELMGKMGCFVRTLGYQIKIDLTALQDVLSQIPDLIDTRVVFHSTKDVQWLSTTNTLYALNVCAKGYGSIIHKHGVFNIVIPYALGVHSIETGSDRVEVVESLLGSGNWRL